MNEFLLTAGQSLPELVIFLFRASGFFSLLSISSLFQSFKSKFFVCFGVQGIQRHENSFLRWYNRQLWMDVLLFFRKKGSFYVWRCGGENGVKFLVGVLISFSFHDISRRRFDRYYCFVTFGYTANVATPHMLPLFLARRMYLGEKREERMSGMAFFKKKIILLAMYKGHTWR